MEKKLTLEEIDRRNSKVRIPKWCIDGNGGSIEELETIFITREDGSEVSLAKAVYADIDWLHQSHKRPADRGMQGLVDLRTEGAAAVLLGELSLEDFIKVFGRTQ